MKKIIFLLIFLIVLSNVTALTLDSVKISPDKITPGEEASVEIKVRNNLEEDIKFVGIKLDLSGTDLPFASYSSGAEKMIDELKNGRSTTFKFNLISAANAKPQLYKIPVIMTYTLNDQPITKTNSIGILISAQPKIEITIDENNLITEKESDIIFRIINKGLGNAKFLNVKLKPALGYTIVNADSIYIGDLDSNEDDTVKFILILSDAGRKDIMLSVEINYYDSDNKEYKKELNVFAKVYTKEEALDLGLIKETNYAKIFSFVLLLVVMFLAYRWFKKRKNDS